MRVYLNPYATWPELRERGLGAWVATPGYILEQIRKLDAEYAIVGKELRAQIEECLPDKPSKDEPYCVSRRAFTQNVWTPLKISWDAFVANHQAWYNRLWGATVDVINEYQEKLRALRSSAEQNGFRFQSPQPPAPTESSWTKIGALVKFVVIGGIVVGGLAVAYKLIPDRVKAVAPR